MFDETVRRAIAKRDRIIEREGDLNGFRQTSEYLEMLINEATKEDLLIAKLTTQTLEV